MSESVVAPLRQRTLAGLDRLYGVVPVKSTTVFTFAPAEGAAPIDLRAMVRGPDGVPYVIDRSTKAVYRVDLKTRKATVVAKSGQKASGGTVSTPRYLAVGGPDLLILDAKNQLWRWRPADTKGKGTLVRVNVKGSTSWGSDILGIATFLRDQSRGLYNLYVVDPSEQQIEAYSPAADGNGFPAAPTAWLATARDVSAMTSIYVDGDLFAVDGGTLDRFVSGKNDGWDATAPDDTLLRPAPTYSIVAGATDRRVGDLYAFDRPNSRIVAVGKKDGAYHAQYRLAGGAADWSDLRAMYVIAGVDTSPRPSSGCRATASTRPSSKPCRTMRPQARLPARRRTRHRARRRHRAPRRARRRRVRRRRSRPRSRDPPGFVIPLRDANPTRRSAIVTLAMVVACCVAFAWELGLGAGSGDAALNRLIVDWGVVPAQAHRQPGPEATSCPLDTATLVTSQFLHGGWLHLLGNMLYLWIFGNNVEDRFGRLGFLLFYLVGGVVAGLAQVAVDPTSGSPTIGASGAIAATLGAYIVLFPRARVTSLIFLGFFYQLLNIPAVVVLGFWFVLQLVDGFASLGVAESGGVAFFAHIGGFVLGAMVGFAAKHSPIGPVGRQGVG